MIDNAVIFSGMNIIFLEVIYYTLFDIISESEHVAERGGRRYLMTQKLYQIKWRYLIMFCVSV